MVTTASKEYRQFRGEAYRFIEEALRHSQVSLGRDYTNTDRESHITGAELLLGVKELGQRYFGMMAPLVFRNWGLHTTYDVGRLIWDMVQHGEMRKTEHDRLTDFEGVFDFHEVFWHNYAVNTRSVARK